MLEKQAQRLLRSQLKLASNEMHAAWVKQTNQPEAVPSRHFAKLGFHPFV